MKIALLSTSYLEAFYKKELKELDLADIIDVYVYYTYEHVVDLYRQISEQYDRILAGGTAPMRIIQKAYPKHKPMRNIECGISNFYREITRVIFEYQDFTLQYGYFDFCDVMCPDNAKSLIEKMRQGKFEDWFEKNQEFINQVPPNEIWDSLEAKRNKHIELWKSGTVKYTLSRRSLIVPDLLKAGVNCRFVNCNQDDILKSSELLMHDITIQNLKKNRPAVIDIKPYPNTEENRQKIRKCLMSYSKKYLCDFLQEDQDDFIQVFTNHHSVEKLTCDFQTCTLKTYLEEKCDFRVSIGYGLGESLQDAISNSLYALKESINTVDYNSYLINVKKNKIGLFGDGKLVAFSSDVSPQILNLAEETGLSTLTIQKILKAKEILGDTDFTSQDLADILHITLRSANRMLDNMVRYHMAALLYHRQKGTKGRPQKVYRIIHE